MYIDKIKCRIQFIWKNKKRDKLLVVLSSRKISRTQLNTRSLFKTIHFRFICRIIPENLSKRTIRLVYKIFNAYMYAHVFCNKYEVLCNQIPLSYGSFLSNSTTTELYVCERKGTKNPVTYQFHLRESCI